MKQLDKGKGGGVNSGTRARVDSEYKETLDENEISRRKANRWQDMFMACYSEDEIAKRVDVNKTTINRTIERLMQSSTKTKMHQSFSPQLYDIWNFAKKTNQVGH